MCKCDGNSAVTPVRRLTVGSVAIQTALGGGQQVSSISYSYLVNEESANMGTVALKNWSRESVNRREYISCTSNRIIWYNLIERCYKLEPVKKVYGYIR